MVENYSQWKSSKDENSEQNIKKFNINIHIKGNTNIFRVPILYVSFNLWHYTILLLHWQWRKLDLHHGLCPLTFQNSCEAVFLKPHEEKPLVLFGDALIRGRAGLTYSSMLRKSSKGRCLWYERRRVNMRQKALRAPLATGRWGRKEPSYK